MYKVNNPTSKNHLVRLNVNQTIRLRLDDVYFGNNHKVYFDNDNFLIQDVESHSSYKVYYITQAFHVEKWAKYTNAHLGNIFIDGDKNSSDLSVFVNTTNKSKKDFFTVVNPINLEIRLSPGDLLEVVLYDELFFDASIWSWDYEPALKSNLELVQSSQLNLSPESEDYPDDHFARCLRVTEANKPYYQSHFWFRFDKQILGLIDSENGCMKIGQLKLYGYFHKNSGITNCHNLDLYVEFDSQLKVQNKEKAFRSLLVPSTDCQLKHPNDKPLKNVHFPALNWLKPKRKLMHVEAFLLSPNSIEDGCVTKNALSHDENLCQNQNYYGSDRFEHHENFEIWPPR
jgi:hypothetical protein